MKTTIVIKDTFGNNLFTYECENNTIKKTVEEAVKQNKALRVADLRDANLNGANLRDAGLSGANLCRANLYEANLSGAILCSTNLLQVNLRAANLDDANLQNADLRAANLDYADLQNANLRNAILIFTNLSKTKNTPFIPLACPSEGAFVAWKKVDNCIIKLFIPEDAKRTSATSNKCRCDKAKVLEIVDLTTNEHIDEVINEEYAKCVYKVGEMVYPDKFDEYRWNECSNGIHFFINKQEAIEY